MTCEEAIKAIEGNVLVALDNQCLDEGYFCYTKTIAKSIDCPKLWVTAALKSLREQGLVVYSKGLYREDECQVAGSGYGLTQTGREKVRSF